MVFESLSLGLGRLRVSTAIRAFVAVRVAGPACNQLIDTRKRLEGILPRRVLETMEWERGGFHITLRFLGKLSPGQVESLNLSETGGFTQRPSHRQFDLSLGGLGLFPEVGPPRVVWVGVEGDVPALDHIQRHAEVLASVAGCEPSDFPFRPHITVGRFGDMTQAEGESVRREIGAMDAPVPATWTVGAVGFFSSVRGPSGAVYKELSSLPLALPHEQLVHS